MTTTIRTIQYPNSVALGKRVSIAHAMNNRDKYDFGFMDEHREQFDKCKLVDDYGYSAPNGCENAKLFVVGNEYGYTHLIHAQHDCDAYIAAVDEMRTVEPNEVHEAYNSFDKLLERMESLGYEDNQQLRGFCNRWAQFYFEASTKIEGAFDNWELDESYQYQSNSSGTGIVNVGHYLHMREIDWKLFRAVRKV